MMNKIPLHQNNNKIYTGRVRYLDVAKGMTIILMILGHCAIPNYLAKIIFIFHMPLFFIVCGFLTLPNGNFDFRKKFNKLIVPYIIIFFASIIPYYHLYNNFDIIYIFAFLKTRTLLHFNINGGIGPIWFLPCYFISNYYIFKFRKITSYKVIFIVAFIIFTLSLIISKYIGELPFLIYQSSLGAVFIIVGYLCKKYRLVRNPYFVILGAISTILCLLYGDFSMYSSICKLWILQIIAGTFITLIVFEICKKIKTNTVLEYISKNSLKILCIHSFDWCFNISYSVIQNLHLSLKLQFIFYCIFIIIIFLSLEMLKECINSCIGRKV